MFQERKKTLDENLFFWTTLFFGVGIFLFVPQISDIWTQGPPLGGGWAILLGYGAFVSFLITYYTLSVFLVVRPSPVPRIQNWVDGRVNRQMTRWRMVGRRRFLSPWYWFSLATWRLPDLTSRWLVEWASDTHQPAPGAQILTHITRLDAMRLSHFLRVSSIVLALLSGLALIAGVGGESSTLYPLAGVFCHTSGVLGLLVGVWLLIQALLHWGRGDTNPSSLSISFGRVLAWLIVGMLGGELLWYLAHSERLGVIFSYRLYTIWAAVHLLATLIILGLLIDRWHSQSPSPIRQIVLVLLVAGVWWFTRAVPLSQDDVRHDLTVDQRAVWTKEQKTPPSQTQREQETRNQQWFEQFSRRIKAVPKEGPVVIVAASGGGSRAAIFTVLAYETLAHTPIDPSKPIFAEAVPPGNGTWADNVVLISSVSEGSLATAYFMERLGRFDKEERRVKELRNTTRGELMERLEKLAEKLLLEFPTRADDFVSHHLAGWQPQASRTDRLDFLRGRSDDLVGEKDALRKRRSALKDQQNQLKKKGDDDDLANSAQRETEIRRLEIEIVTLDDEIDVLEQFLAIVRAYDFILAPKDEAARSRLTPAQRDSSAWVLNSRAFDEMCLDFMAPIMRGTLSPTLDRGDSLARFWTGRFGWQNCTNLRGYGGSLGRPNYPESHPLILFDACDVGRGTRLAVGFPPLPNDLWQTVYNEKKLSHYRAESLSEMGTGFEVSLARAVRMSSNFPFGFRVMNLATGERLADGEPVLRHVLDGGVVDNTGLDTIYELFHALELHAQKQDSPYQGRASEVLQELRQRGVVILEIDAGAKPENKLRGGLLAGQTEPIQALNNAAYTNADQVKALYLKETRRILNQNLEPLIAGDPHKDASLADLRDNLPVTTLHLPFVCTPYQPGEESQSQEVMTAWTLGPADKAEVVQRFFIDLAMWDMRRRVVRADLSQGQYDFRIVEVLARVKVLLDQIAGLNRAYQRLQDDIHNGGPAPGRDLVQKFQDRYLHLRQGYLQFQQQAARTPDRDVAAAWHLLQSTATEIDQLMQRFIAARTPQEWRGVQSILDKNREGSRQRQKQIDTTRGAVNDSLTQQFRYKTGLGSMFDPQQKYDRSTKRSQMMYEK